MSTDLEKQQSINVFLGVYVPASETCPLWDLASDFLLHNAKPRGATPPHDGSEQGRQ